MLIRLGYDIEFNIPQPVAIVALLNVHPSREPDLREPDILHIEPAVTTEQYFDRFGNRCTRFMASQGKLRIWNSTLVQDSGEKDQVNYQARQHPVLELPVDSLTYLLNSRYCEVDRMSKHRDATFCQYRAGMGTRAGDCELDSQQCAIRISTRSRDQDRPGCLQRARRRLPRLSAPRHHSLPLHEQTGALRHRLPGRHRRPGVSAPMDFSAWFEVVFGRQVVDI